MPWAAAEWNSRVVLQSQNAAPQTWHIRLEYRVGMSFRDWASAQIVGDITHSFASFWESECAEMKVPGLGFGFELSLGLLL